VPEPTHPYQLFADEFTREDIADLIDFDCGQEPWAQAATQWICGSDVWESVRSRGTNVWVYRNNADVIVGFGSLGVTRRRWPPPDGGHSNFLFIPMLGIDKHFHGQPADEQFRYSRQIMSHLRFEAIQILSVHRLADRSTLPILSLLVHRDNARAIMLYERFGFVVENVVSRLDQLMMTQSLSMPTS